MSTRRLDLTVGAAMLCMASFITFTGCVATAGPGGASVYVAPPVPSGVVVFGGPFDRGRDVRAYSHRGYQSRASTRSGRGQPGPRGHWR